VRTPNGTVKAFDISSASTHDIHYLNDLKIQLSNCVFVGDKGYLSRLYQQDLFDTTRRYPTRNPDASQPT
jgi:hypothetical protein